MAPQQSMEIPTDLVDSLKCKSPHDALLALANESEQLAAKLAEELANSLSGASSNKSPLLKRKGSKLEGDGKENSNTNVFPIVLPKSLRDAPPPQSSTFTEDDDDNNSTDEKPVQKETPSRTLHKSSPSHPLTHATLATESILSSLSKIASGGSAASSEMRTLEYQRQHLDAEATDLEHALAIREGCTRGSDSLMGRRYADAARAVSDVNSILDGKDGLPATERARELAGGDALEAHAKATEVLKRAIGERYELAVQNGDVAGLSELTPLLGMLDMAELGVKLYLQYSQSVLCQGMNLEVNTEAPMDLPQEEGMSRAAMRRRAQEQHDAAQNMSVPLKLAKIYNTAVTHLRHHLPMVAYALGEADGDAALVQLVHVEAEKRSVDILREYMQDRELGRTVRRAEIVADKMEGRYTGMSNSGAGGSGDEMDGLFGMDEKNITNVIMGLGGDAMGGSSIVARRNAAQREDCGFTIEVGNLSDVDAALEEWALVMQHTESYERFIRHAVTEVIKARKLRKEQKREEKQRLKEMEDANNNNSDSSALLGSPGVSSPRSKTNTLELAEDLEEDQIDILPPHTALNEVAAEIGGYYSSLERCLLLAGMQRAFIHANFPDESTFTPVAIGNSHHQNGAGSHALQTNLVDECLFAARRSTMRAFATGHTGTASAAANVCVDVLGRVLLDVLIRRAELGASLVKPGEGLLGGHGSDGLAGSALSFAKSTAGKGFRGVQGAAARAGAKVGDANEETAEELRQRTLLGVARAAANFNDLEVVADYTKRLEGNFLKEIDAGYPRGHDTEQLRMCVKGLGGVVELFSQASSRSVEELISTVLPRVRQIVNDAVGQEVVSTSAATNFLGSPVLTVGGTTAVASTVLDYNLDDAAFELSQISEGCIGRMCSSLDELIEPLRVHLVPKLSDNLVIGILGGVSKRLEAAIRKSKFTPLGAIRLDSDIRYLMNFTKDRMDSPELKSNVTLCKVCPPLARLNQITLLMNVEDLEDALDLISVSKRKGNWDLKLDDAKILLSLRVDFEGNKVNDLLQIEDE